MKRRRLLQQAPAAVLLPFVDLPKCTSPTIIPTAFQHSVCRWCYPDYDLEALCDMAKSCGIQSIELLHLHEWDTVLARGLKVALSNGSPLGISKGFNTPAHHDQLHADLLPIIPAAAEKGIPQIIVFSGNRNGMSDDDGLEHCARGLEPVVRKAERYGVQIVMELLNSKIDHIDYQCDHTAWGVRLVEKLGSPNFKLLYDIYHMQIMEGDVIRTIEDHAAYIGHYHTAGVPGRHEIDETQELYYPAIMRAIRDTGFTGFVAQEFIPRQKDPVSALCKAIEICSV